MAAISQPTPDWLKNASPDDVITHGKMVFSRIGQLDQTYRDQFVSEIKRDPNAARLLEQLTPA